MNEQLAAALARAIQVKHTILNRKNEHKASVRKLEEERSALYMQAINFVEDSPAMDEFHRQLDLLDKQEFQLHDEYRKFLRRSDERITIAIREMLQSKFGPDFSWDSIE